MARRRRRNTDEERDDNSIASFAAPLRSTYDVLAALEDRRTFHPLGDVRPARGVSKQASQVLVEPARHAAPKRFAKRKRPVLFGGSRDGALGLTPDVFRFRDVSKVAICMRRVQRREVLHALRKTGKGSRAKRRRRNYYSDVSCAR